MSQRIGLVSYDGLPVSSGGGHGMGATRPLSAWEAFQHFLTACTTASTPTTATVAIHPAPTVDPRVIDTLRETVRILLGLSASPDRNDDWRDSGSSESWHIANAKVAAAINWLEELGRQPKHWLGGPAEVCLDFVGLRLRSLDGCSELPFQGGDCYLRQSYNGYGVLLGESRCRLRLTTNRCTLSTILFLPFERPDKELWQYAGFLQSHLPVSLSQVHWTNWKLVKKGTAYLNRRISDVPQLGKPHSRDSINLR